MKNFKIIVIPFLLLVLLSSCDKNDEIDKQKPEIDLSVQGAFPLNCDTLYFGEMFNFKVLFRDNVELGSKDAFSIDIHHNFDHHSHTTEVSECNLSPVKAPLNPFLSKKIFNIDNGLQEYETNLSISIPAGNEKGEFDEGDYHFFISLTDKSGWSSQKGLSIKILKR